MLSITRSRAEAPVESLTIVTLCQLSWKVKVPHQWSVGETPTWVPPSIVPLAESIQMSPVSVVDEVVDLDVGVRAERVARRRVVDAVRR